MIVIKVDRDTNGNIESFSMNGHAESGPYGYDLVCAGVSSIAFGSINALEALCHLNAEAITELDTKSGGFLRCVLPRVESKSTHEKIQLLLEGMLVSFHTMEANYGEHIQINDLGGGKYVKA